MTNAPIEYRALETQADFAACVELQKDTWGSDFTEVVPPTMLQISQKVGGVAAGAFDAGGQLVGFVYGVSGVREQRPAHWSHMLAVRPELEGEGIGRRLKAFQRQFLLAHGIGVVFWTFDPLVARNAHLNLNRLGATIDQYVPNIYGANTGSPLHSGLGTDRFVVRWELTAPSVERALAGRLVTAEAGEAPIVNTAGSEPTDIVEPVALPLRSPIRIEVPKDIQAVKAISHELGMRWRTNTRRAVLWYLEQGYTITGFGYDKTDGTYCYYLKGPENE